MSNNIRLKVITINEAVLALEALKKVEDALQPHRQFQIKKIEKTLNDSLEIARTFVTGDEKKDQWLAKATTLPFEPLVLKECFGGLQKIEPATFIALKRLCS